MKSAVFVGDREITNPFLRFMLRSWVPKPTVASTVWTYGAFATIMYIASIALFVYNANLYDYTIESYDRFEQCSVLGETCNATFTLPRDMPGPVYLQYGLTNFYQNNKKYMASKSGNQLAGKSIDDTEARKMCYPIVYNKDLFTNTNTSWGGIPLDPQALADPCGLIAKSVFNDTFSVYYSNGTNILVNQSGIAWPWDNGRRFRRGPDSSNTQWIDPVNEHFMVWMRTSGDSNFVKPWGIIKQGLPAGSYVLSISNNYNIGLYGSHKNVKFSSVGVLGSRNYTLPIVLLVFGTVFMVGVIVFLCRFRATGGKFGPKLL